MKTPVTFALVGAGGIAQSYAQAFASHPRAQLVAVVDPRFEAAEAMAKSLDCSAFRSVQELLNQAQLPEAVVVSTPPNTHEEIVTQFLRRGVHVWCEKPFALSCDSAHRMIQAAREANRIITMASKFRYVEDIIEAKKMIDSGEIGELKQVENTFASRVDMSGRWNSNPEMSGGGVIMDNGTHSVDLMRYFLGSLREMLALEAKREQSPRVEDTARLFVRSKQETIGSIDLSWNMQKETEWFLTIYGSLGTIQIGWKQSRYKTHARPEWIVYGQGYNKLHAFQNQLSNFAGAIREDEPLRVTDCDAVASVEAIEAAYLSLRASRWAALQPRLANLTTTPLPIEHVPSKREVSRA